MTIIDSFTGEYAFLSNFYQSPIQMDIGRGVGLVVFPTAEHLFHAFKVLYCGMTPEDEAKEIAHISKFTTPGLAKKYGRTLPLDVTRWNKDSTAYMEWAVTLKFLQNNDLLFLLLCTGDSTLIEGNTWGDKIWGQVNGVGENRLGNILMRVRSVLSLST